MGVVEILLLSNSVSRHQKTKKSQIVFFLSYILLRISKSLMNVTSLNLHGNSEKVDRSWKHLPAEKGHL